MSPGGGAADPRQCLLQGPLPDLWPRISHSLHRLPFAWMLPDRTDRTEALPDAPLYPAIVPVQQQFSRPAVPAGAKLPRL